MDRAAGLGAQWPESWCRTCQKEGNCDDQHCGHQCIVLEDSGVCTHGAQQTGSVAAVVHTGPLKGKPTARWGGPAMWGLRPAGRQSHGLAMAQSAGACRQPRSTPRPQGSGGPRQDRTALERLQSTGAAAGHRHRGHAAPGCSRAGSSWGVTSSRGRSPAGPAGAARRTRVPAGRGAQVPSGVSRDARGKSAASSGASVGTQTEPGRVMSLAQPWLARCSWGGGGEGEPRPPAWTQGNEGAWGEQKR